jgi:hypothetical protein
MQHHIDIARHMDELGEIAAREGELRMLQQVRDVGRRTRQQVVQTGHPMPVGQQPLAQVTAHESCPTGDHHMCALHPAWVPLRFR